MSKRSMSDVVAGVLVACTFAGACACAATTPVERMPQEMRQHFKGIMNWMVPYVSPMHSRVIHPALDHAAHAHNAPFDAQSTGDLIAQQEHLSPMEAAGEVWEQGFRKLTECFMSDMASAQLQAYNK